MVLDRKDFLARSGAALAAPVAATAFMTSIAFEVAAMGVIGLAIHLFVPGAG